MALRGIFIGINKYQDPSAPELNGARWDAVALCTLFQDAMPAIAAVCLVDEGATLDVIREHFRRVLEAADPEDMVIISFSGHGTRDHRLVFHDTDRGRYDATTMPMAELADAFKRSRAKAILCILDCCFSGAAPARVLADTPAPRDMTTPLEQIAGQGRVIIAAANLNEAAWELPGKGHGLLTKAILDVFQAAKEPLNVLTAMDDVMAAIRAESARLSKTQTPVLLGTVEGGLMLPPFRPGPRYYAAFPERRGARVTKALGELSVFGVPQSIIEAWSEQFSEGLNSLQMEAVNECRVMDGESVVVVAPTGAGKTFIGELAAVKAIAEQRKAVFLLPYRALVNEKYEDFENLYGQRLGMRVIQCKGDFSDHQGAFIRGKYDIAILTYEMFLNIALASPFLLDQLGLVVLDEAHFICDPSRGITVELLLTLLLAARQRGVTPQILALSAVIGGINSFDRWLQAKLLSSTVRPVPLVEGVLDRQGVFQFIDDTGTVKQEQLLPREAIQVRRNEESAQDVIVPLAKKLIHDHDETVIVFRNIRGLAEGCATYLANELGLPAATSALAALPITDLSTTARTLRQCLNKGTAFHTSNLTREERVAVERTFRSKDKAGELRIMAATTTLAAGINTPASTIILAEQEFVGEDGRPFTIAEYKNMAGRAGRPGYNRPGRAIILANDGWERDRLFKQYVLGKPEPMRSSFEPGALNTWVLRLLTQIEKVRASELVHLLASTYGGFLSGRGDPTWQSTIERRLGTLVEDMLQLELLEKDGLDIRLSLLGRACGRSNLSFDSCMSLVGLLRRVFSGTPQQLDATRLMITLQVLPESDGGYTPLMTRGSADKKHPSDLAQRVGENLVRALQQRTTDDNDWHRRCKRSLVLLDWIAGVGTETIESRYSPNPYQGKISVGDIRRFAEATRFHLRSAYQIAKLIYIQGGPSEESIDELLRQLETGVPADTLALLELPMNWTRGECLALRSRGLKKPQDLWAADGSVLEEILGKERTKQLLKLKPEEQVT